jgi:hypothetical protein
LNANEFASRLARLAPSCEVLSALGLGHAEIDRFRRSFVCVPRATGTRAVAVDSAIELVDGWDASRVEIGMVWFADSSRPCPGGVQIGVVEVNPLVVLDGSGEIVEVDEC